MSSWNRYGRRDQEHISFPCSSLLSFSSLHFRVFLHDKGTQSGVAKVVEFRLSAAAIHPSALVSVFGLAHFLGVRFFHFLTRILVGFAFITKLYFCFFKILIFLVLEVLFCFPTNAPVVEVWPLKSRLLVA